ncbi:unnamed protein product [Rotaria sp. Silwood1]|nr:unnamed protein product [Rotaria sp. Silwood1]CAF1399633.1 unnamed protein product [Rotaria sp. Silwood1]CAF3665187.1 unnamed protein product [Rotaria sp. Silwood1]CAF4921010.1 unnamed protein product [Rotaria sp. Silwood1]CAF4961647.1 unnamed protein product [Rotaria sp. Silwood1]
MIIFILNKINSQILSTVQCRPVLNYYFKYLTNEPPGKVHYLNIQATYILQGRYVGYYTGTLTYARSSDSLNGIVTASFSDRIWVVSCPLLLCPRQNFNYQATDKQTFTITRSGSFQNVLNSWGNAKFIDQLQCYGVNQPFFIAPKKQSASMFVMTLQTASSDRLT